MSAPKRPQAVPGSAPRARSTKYSYGRSGGGEARPVALAGVGGQRELRDQQQRAAGLADIEVHSPGFVRKDAVGQHAFEQAIGLAFRVAFFDRDQCEDTPADPADRLSVHMDGGFGYPLQQSNHRVGSVPVGAFAVQAAIV